MCLPKIGLCAVVLVGLTSTTFARPRSLLELKTKENTYRGKLVCSDDETCWLMARDGRLEEVPLESVEKYRTVEPRFRPFRAAVIRDRLRREFGRSYEIVGTAHYLVCAERGKAKAYAGVFEDVYRSFHGYFSRRGFKIEEPKFPLVAIVFPNREEFVRYSQQDGLSAVPGLLGYYHPRSNRVALFDTGKESLTSVSRQSMQASATPLLASSHWTNRIAVFGGYSQAAFCGFMNDQSQHARRP